jgi:hypothetical protein
MRSTLFSEPRPPFLICFRLRNGKELQSLIDELSAIYDPQTIRSIYEEATDDPFSFLYVDLCARKKPDMFWKRFDGGRILPDEA